MYKSNGFAQHQYETFDMHPLSLRPKRKRMYLELSILEKCAAKVDISASNHHLSMPAGISAMSHNCCTFPELTSCPFNVTRPLGKFFVHNVLIQDFTFPGISRWKIMASQNLSFIALKRSTSVTTATPNGSVFF